MKFAVNTLTLLFLAAGLAACDSGGSESASRDDASSAEDGAAAVEDSSPADKNADKNADEGAPEESAGEESSPAAGLAPAADCPVGTWVAGAEELDAWFDSFQAEVSAAQGAPPPDPDAANFGGTMVLTFRPDGSYQIAFDKFGATIPASSFSTSMTGTETGTWTGGVPSLKMTTTKLNVTDATQTVDGKTEQADLGPDAGTGFSWGETVVECDGATLTSTSKDGGVVLVAHAR